MDCLPLESIDLTARTRQGPARHSASRNASARAAAGLLCDLPLQCAPTHPAHDRSEHGRERAQPPIATSEVQAPKTAVPVFCGCFTGGCRGANRGVKMVPQFMEQHARHHQVAKKVQRKDKRRGWRTTPPRTNEIEMKLRSFLPDVKSRPLFGRVEAQLAAVSCDQGHARPSSVHPALPLTG